MLIRLLVLCLFIPFRDPGHLVNRDFFYSSVIEMYSIYLLVSCYVSPFKGFLSFSLFKHSSSVCVSIKYDIPAPGFKGSQIYIQTWRRVSRTLLTASQGIRAASRGCEEVMGTVGAGDAFFRKGNTFPHT